MLFDKNFNSKIPIFFPYYIEELTPEDSANFSKTRVKTDFGYVDINTQLGASHRELLVEFLKENKDKTYIHDGKLSLKIDVEKKYLYMVEGLNEALFYVENNTGDNFSFRVIDGYKALPIGDSRDTLYIIFSGMVTKLVENDKLNNLSFIKQ